MHAHLLATMLTAAGLFSAEFQSSSTRQSAQPAAAWLGSATASLVRGAGSGTHAEPQPVSAPGFHSPGPISNDAGKDTLRAADTLTPKAKLEKHAWVNLKGGIVLPDLYKPGSRAVRPPVLVDAFLGWQAGLSIEFAHYRYYGARIELSYVRKGARETFSEYNNQIVSTTRLDYGQVAVLPLILKSDFKRVSPFIGAGAYGAYLLNARHHVSVNGGGAVADEQFGSYLSKLDYGWLACVGGYLWRHPLELRYEVGLTNLFQDPALNARNQALSLHFSF